MVIVRILIGFIAGIVVSGAVLVLLTTYIPLLSGSNAPKQADISQNQSPAVENETPAAEIIVKEKTVKETPKAVVVAPVQEPAPEVEVAVVEPEQPVAVKPEPEAEVAPAPEAVVAQPDPEPAEPEVVPEVEAPEVVELPKKITLPTIEPITPAPMPEEVVVVAPPVAETGITVGKKPSSTLPTITQKAPTDVVEKAAQETTPDNALEFNATAFEKTDRPMLGLILVDIGQAGLDVDKLKKLNAPLTIAIRVSDPNASERALRYNDAGFEVIAMAAVNQAAALNKAGNAEQVQNALDVIFNTVPNAIGLLDNAQGSIQKNNRISGDIVNSLQTTGHGLITNVKGLNTIDRVAGAVGVRSGKVARSLDANGEGKIQMVRYLDKASLDAGRDGSVIILGTTSKDTIATVAVWLLGSKGQSIVLAPVSAVLLRE
ncbi:MAG: divergent polysaccharide deacetylase family protein, partial [Proteobacteria bacterium]|nr:divergent polysaccharide deacetylase family protein [Pseudomonadota bacterium]